MESLVPQLLGLAWLLPLASFTLIVLFGPRMGKAGVLASYVATGAILGGLLLSLASLGIWLRHHPIVVAQHHGEHGDAHEGDHSQLDRGISSTQLTPVSLRANSDEDADGEHVEHAAPHGPHAPAYMSGTWYSLGQFGKLKLEIGYYIDCLTVCMFCMVTLIATCIHFYASGYMHDELHEVTDHEVHLANGHHLHRKGRFHRFFQYLSLFCFSMLGLVISGNIAMVFVFWELVGICSYFLIGFYIERKSASTAANKAFIVNRVGDFGMIIGLMALFGSLGTFSFGDTKLADGTVERGVFSLVRPAERNYDLAPADGMVKAAAADEIANGTAATPEQIETWRGSNYGYWLLVVAGLGIFCGCVGKSAQFPLHVWLPDAMEGPTPVSALVHSATMVAAGVYLVGRFFPVFAPEALLVIAYTGAITLFLAATIAITATDIKRVLAYSTVSQLGYMMLALGIGGWLAGLYHLFTHAFFKSLLFMCSGSVIHACHTNEMPKMGGLRKKMPWTAYTMLVGCLAIAGAGVPFVIGFSGYYSKDAIIAQAISFTQQNPSHSILFYAAAGGAAITAFYMFRLWYMTFAGTPRDHHIYDHAHESPKVMYLPLVVLSVFAVAVAWRLPLTNLSLENLLEQARPAGVVPAGVLATTLVHPEEHVSHDYHVKATLVAFATALSGFLVATAFYGLRLVDAADVRRKFAPIYTFLLNKWYFDELYRLIFIRPVLWFSGLVSNFDKQAIDGVIHGAAGTVRRLSNWDDWIDRTFVDGAVNLLAKYTHAAGLALRAVQTGRLRTYVVSIVIGAIVLFVLISHFGSWVSLAAMP